MINFPFAKINLGLHVVEKRVDGFHAIETLFYPVALHDVLEVLPSDIFSIRLYGLHVEGNAEENLCVKAYRLLQEKFKIPPVSIHLYKNIPTGAGLGGGSSDGAAMLKILNDLFSLQLSVEQLEFYAAQLGSDCPFFIHQKPMFATGRGEVLSVSEINLQSYFIVLAKPSLFVSTADAYSGVTPKQPKQPLLQKLSVPIDQWKNELVNDFEISVFEKFPLLAQLKQQFYNAEATYAAMSGSGATIFGLFDNEEKAINAAQQIPHVIWHGAL